MNIYEVRPRVEAGGFLVFKRDAALPVAIVPLNHRDPVEVRASADAIAAALTLVDKGEPPAVVSDAKDMFGPSLTVIALEKALRTARDCVADLGAGKGGWAWEEVLQEIDAALVPSGRHKK